MDLRSVLHVIETNIDAQVNEGRTDDYRIECLMDEDKIKKILVSIFGQPITALNLPQSYIKNLVFQPISLVQYAKENEISYSSVFKNKNSYATLKETHKNQNNTYTVAKYELCHCDRANVWGDRAEYLINNNKIVKKKLIALSLQNGTDPGTTIFRLIMSLPV